MNGNASVMTPRRVRRRVAIGATAVLAVAAVNLLSGGTSISFSQETTSTTADPGTTTTTVAATLPTSGAATPARPVDIAPSFSG